MHLNIGIFTKYFFQACEEAIAKLKSTQTSSQTSIHYVVNQIIYPLSQGCETKDVKLIRVSKK